MRVQDLAPQLDRRPAAHLGAFAVAVLGVYWLVVMTGVVSHEQWFDEAQSWLLAKDASMGELLTQYLRYEGHPPLWYALLYIPAKLGMPYGVINVLSAVCMSLGVILFLRLPAVPWPVRLLAPFGFFMAYQYAVVARSYALVLPLLMALAHVYPRRRGRVLTFTLLLVALSNVSLHGLAMAWAFAALYAGEVWLGPALDASERRRHLAALGLFLVATALLLAVLWPPDDLLIGGQITLANGALLLGRMFGDGILAMFSGSKAVSAVMLLVYLLWFHRQRLLLTFLAPACGVYAITGLYSNRWHEGLFYMLWLFVLCLSWRRPAPRAWRLGVLAVTLAVLVQQAVWAGKTLRYDIQNPYSASREAAEMIAANRLDEHGLFAIGFTCLALQPYFEEPLFDNYRAQGGYTFWDWSTSTPLFHPVPGRTTSQKRAWLEKQLAQKPDFVLLGVKFKFDIADIERLREAGYEDLGFFEGALFWKDRQVESDAYVLLRRRAP